MKAGLPELLLDNPLDHHFLQINAPSAYCARCGLSVGEGEALASGCSNCHGKRFPWTRIIRLGSYAYPLDQMLLQMKYASLWQWAHTFGEQLAAQCDMPLSTSSDNLPVVIPVPMPRLRYVLRGYNQAMLMARSFATAKQWPLHTPLRRTHLRALHRFNREKRYKIAQNFRISRFADKYIAGKTCILVDDIFTTGATVKSCARLLKKAGATQVIVAVAAVTDPKDRRVSTITLQDNTTL